VHADPEPDGQPGARQLLDDLQVGLIGLAAAAQLLGVGQAEQARLAEQGELLPGEPALGLGLGDGRAQLLVGDLPGQAEQTTMSSIRAPCAPG
jgi:hypothetical protein